MSVSEEYLARRNLMVLSMLVILFNLSGMTIAQSSNNLFNISLASERTFALLIWVILFWSAFRYWQFHKFKVIKRIREEVAMDGLHSFWWNWFLKKTTGKPAKEVDGGVYISVIEVIDGKLVLYFGNFKIMHGSTELIRMFTRSKDYTIPVKGFSGWLCIALSSIKRSILYPTLLSYSLPYLLFAAAIAAILY